MASKPKQTAKEYAQQQLGTMDLSYLDKERENAQNTYNTSNSSLQTNFNNLLQQIENNRADTRKNFNTGRATVAEQSYNANRTNQADLASRGVGSSGLKGLGEVGNRIETGRQYSNLANDFYNNMNELKTTEEQGRSQYDIDQQVIKNTLDQALAGIDTRRGEAQNNYNMTLGQLAEQVQGRWDANDNAAKALQQAKDAAAQAHKDAVAAAKQNLELKNKEDFTKILGSGKGRNAIISDLETRFGLTNQEAQYVLSSASDTGFGPYVAGYNPNFDYLTKYIYKNGIKK
jgi:hypothetical protein